MSRYSTRRWPKCQGPVAMNRTGSEAADAMETGKPLGITPAGCGDATLDSAMTEPVARGTPTAIWHPKLRHRPPTWRQRVYLANASPASRRRGLPRWRRCLAALTFPPLAPTLARPRLIARDGAGERAWV